MKKFYVYLLEDPRTNLPFYAGKGCNKRCFSHLKYKKGNRKNIITINEIRKQNLEPKVIFVANDISEDDAFKLELQIIKFYGRKDIDINGILNNVLPGGAQPPNRAGKKCSVETIEKIRLGSKNNVIKKYNTWLQENKELFIKIIQKISNGSTCKEITNELDVSRDIYFRIYRQIDIFCKAYNIPIIDIPPRIHGQRRKLFESKIDVFTKIFQLIDKGFKVFEIAKLLSYPDQQVRRWASLRDPFFEYLKHYQS